MRCFRVGADSLHDRPLRQHRAGRERAAGVLLRGDAHRRRSTGCSSTNRSRRLLEQVLARRTDLHKTINTVLITHDHIDHDFGLRAVVENFAVEHYVDNGFITGAGAPNPNWLRSEVSSGHRHIDIEEIPESEVEAIVDKSGFTDAAIDSINCQPVDPQIHVLEGHILTNPGWSADAYSNLNNHSLITRVDFNGASLLFMGDLEEDGIALLLNYYTGAARQILDADVLQVGHHG